VKGMNNNLAGDATRVASLSQALKDEEVARNKLLDNVVGLANALSRASKSSTVNEEAKKLADASLEVKDATKKANDALLEVVAQPPPSSTSTTEKPKS
jgi:membrane-bound ClpP family serine protease